MNLCKLLHQLENYSNFNLEFILSSVKGKDLHFSESNDSTHVSIKLMKSSIFNHKTWSSLFYFKTNGRVDC